MDISESQSLLMETLPQWNHYIARPFKRFLDEGMSPPMFHGMQRLRLTSAAIQYMDDFKRRQVEYYRELLLSMPEDDQRRFTEAIRTLHDIFGRMPCADGLEGHEKERQ